MEKYDAIITSFGSLRGRSTSCKLCYAEGYAEGRISMLGENVVNMSEAGMDSQTIAKILKREDWEISALLAV